MYTYLDIMNSYCLSV